MAVNDLVDLHSFTSASFDLLVKDLLFILPAFIQAQHGGLLVLQDCVLVR